MATHAGAATPPLNPLVAFDIETTGWSPYKDAVLEIAGVKFQPGGPAEDTFQELAHPGRAISASVRKVTGITDAMVAACRPPVEVLRSFLAWAGPDACFLAHNASFDVRFLNAALLNAAEPVPDLNVVDTLAWARECFPDAGSHALGDLLETLGIPMPDQHRALADAQGVRALVERLLAGESDPIRAVAARIRRPVLPRRNSLLPDSMID
ncbi:MAG: PolC-type DNA polymerase III [Candidatus Hydrogenedentales bacterium]|jgi:DNA polymerase-3 subunit alpha (Gram-positive type)